MSEETPTDFRPVDLEDLKVPFFELPVRAYEPCIYCLVKEDLVVYVGQTIGLPSRIAQHIESGKPFDRAFYFKVPRERLNEVESALIQQLQPALNVTCPTANMPYATLNELGLAPAIRYGELIRYEDQLTQRERCRRARIVRTLVPPGHPLWIRLNDHADWVYGRQAGRQRPRLVKTGEAA